jgi:predicted DNA-binding transcriptional regulator YafY
MPVNKEALIRYRSINKLLIGGKVASKEALLIACSEAIGVEVAWRTIAGDINAMRNDKLLDYNAPIKNIRNEGYCYTDSNYSIDQIPLQKEEVSALSFAAKLLMQYSHVRIFSTFSGAVEKLSQNLDVHLKNQDEVNLGEAIAFEESTADGGSTHLNDFLDHIRRKTVVSIHYHSFSSGSRKRHILHPYFIKEYRNRWYVLGYHEEYQALRTLALERILDLSPDYKVTYRNPEFNVADYYSNVIGVSVSAGEPTDIELKVEPAQWQYLQSQPIHKSQFLIRESEKEIIVGLKVISNYELKSSLLSMGASVTILKPISLRREIVDQAKAILSQYS